MFLCTKFKHERTYDKLVWKVSWTRWLVFMLCNLSANAENKTLCAWGYINCVADKAQQTVSNSTPMDMFRWDQNNSL